MPYQQPHLDALGVWPHDFAQSAAVAYWPRAEGTHWLFAHAYLVDPEPVRRAPLAYVAPLPRPSMFLLRTTRK